MKTTIKRDGKYCLTMTVADICVGEILTTLQALRDSKSPVAYHFLCSIRDAMYLSNDDTLKDAYKIFEDCQKEKLTATE